MDMQDLEFSVNEAARQGKHLFIWDRSGQVATYFAEFGIHKEFITDMVQVALASADRVTGVLDTGLSSLSDSLVQSIKS